MEAEQTPLVEDNSSSRGLGSTSMIVSGSLGHTNHVLERHGWALFRSFQNVPAERRGLAGIDLHGLARGILVAQTGWTTCGEGLTDASRTVR